LCLFTRQSHTFFFITQLHTDTTIAAAGSKLYNHQRILPSPPLVASCTTTAGVRKL
jgi:hypothetical protein